MNCTNCGATMQLFERRGYYRCLHCGSFHFLEQQEEGIRVLGDAPPDLACPLCRAPLALATIDDTHRVHMCRQCRGLLLPRRAFAALVQWRRSWASGAPVPPAPLERTELQREVHCPACRATMATHPYYGPGSIVIDMCDRCDAIWLDAGELNSVVDAPGSDRGSAHRSGEGAVDFTPPRLDPAAAREQERLERLGQARKPRGRSTPYGGRTDLGDLLKDLFS
jgi:Zn-finger nucleic acid-binding protein